MLLPPEERPILHAFEEAIEGTVRCYRLEEVVAEKLRALLQTRQRLHARGWTRPRARDYYDLWRILTKYGDGLERSILPELVAAKCRHRGVGHDSLDSFFPDDLVAQTRRHWQASLSPFVSPLPSCDLVLTELRPLLDGLV